MKDYMILLHQWFCKEPDCRKIREEIVEVERQLRQVLDRQGQGQLLKPADLENELQDEISPESFLSGFKLALGVAAELAPSCFFHDEEEQLACEALRQRKGKCWQRSEPTARATSERERMGGGRGDTPPGTIKAASGLSSTPSPISDPPQRDTTNGPWRNPPSPGSATSSWSSSPAGRFKSSTRTCWRMDGYEKNKRRNNPASAAPRYEVSTPCSMVPWTGWRKNIYSSEAPQAAALS